MSRKKKEVVRLNKSYLESAAYEDLFTINYKGELVTFKGHSITFGELFKHLPKAIRKYDTLGVTDKYCEKEAPKKKITKQQKT